MAEIQCDKKVISQPLGADQTVSLTVYYNGSPIDWTTFDYGVGNTDIQLHIHNSAGTAMKDITLDGATTPTAANSTTNAGVVNFLLANTDFSSYTPGEYYWWCDLKTATAASGKTPPVTGEAIIGRGRFILYSPDGVSSVTHT